MNNKMMLAAAIMAGVAMSTPAWAQPGQCSVTGIGTFACEVVVDGGGFSFALPDGDVLAFTLIEPDLGLAYLIRNGARPGQRPRELDEFTPVPGAPGCWSGANGYQFCAAVFEKEGT